MNVYLRDIVVLYLLYPTVAGYTFHPNAPPVSSLRRGRALCPALLQPRPLGTWLGALGRSDRANTFPVAISERHVFLFLFIRIRTRSSLLFARVEQPRHSYQHTC